MVWIPNSINKEHIEYRQNIAAASVLANDGYMVQFIGPTSNVKGQKTADVLIDGVKWEIKTITAPNKNTVKRSIRTAAKQADNIILNIKSEIKEVELKDAVSDRIRQNTSIREVAVIRKDRTVTRYSRAAILKWKK